MRKKKAGRARGMTMVNVKRRSGDEAEGKKAQSRKVEKRKGGGGGGRGGTTAMGESGRAGRRGGEKGGREERGERGAVLEKLREANFKINAKKCEWAKTQVLYLGHVLDGDGIKPEDSTIAAIRDWPTPRTLTELRSFLGLANYYRKFVRNFSTIAAPLRRLQKKEAIWQWDKDCTSALKKLKRALIEYPVLKVADPSLPFVVTTDASQYGIGAVLQQDDGNGYRPVEFMSTRMPCEKVAASTYEREIYALRQALDHWKHYLLGRHFKVYSDHKTLRWLETQAKMTPKLTRWAAEIDQFDFELKPVKGKYNVVADARSRRSDYFGAVVHYLDIGRDLQEKLVLSDALKRWIEVIEQYDFDPQYLKGEYNKVADALSRRPDFSGQTLLNIQRNLGDPADLKGWIGDPCEDNWEGITCDGLTTITEVSLPSRQLNGTLPDLSALPNLTILAYWTWDATPVRLLLHTDLSLLHVCTGFDQQFPVLPCRSGGASDVDIGCPWKQNVCGDTSFPSTVMQLEWSHANRRVHRNVVGELDVGKAVNPVPLIRANECAEHHLRSLVRTFRLPIRLRMPCGTRFHTGVGFHHECRPKGRHETSVAVADDVFRNAVAAKPAGMQKSCELGSRRMILAWKKSSVLAQTVNDLENTVMAKAIVRERAGHIHSNGETRFPRNRQWFQFAVRELTTPFVPVANCT
ncbi:hypothetical protein CBR_g16907 [Chara braunii]|uniref:Reverse transcriptase/retrotransposon-derived protein RNase H-like domain-containing protein n=1 Tax=Chara braunii TaxID=69332 RepID=A0A388KU19_CHABU|nr:hypothetical protein CBR_g16907 [Chara braunii]|eukprot:GBG73564.1 hypothetical protein CBR_g16907 [Chara braunii]